MSSDWHSSHLRLLLFQLSLEHFRIIGMMSCFSPRRYTLYNWVFMDASIPKKILFYSVLLFCADNHVLISVTQFCSLHCHVFALSQILITADWNSIGQVISSWDTSIHCICRGRKIEDSLFACKHCTLKMTKNRIRFWPWSLLVRLNKDFSLATKGSYGTLA